MTGHDYAVLADLFDYPDADYVQRVMDVHTYLLPRCPAAARSVEEFLDLVPRGDLSALQDLYTRSFDVQAITTLDVGYVLFGEDYKRGDLLFNLMREHREAGNDCGRELADHLPTLLRLLAKLPESEVRLDLIQQIVVPALRQMIGEFDPDRMDKKDAEYEKHYKTLIDSSRHNRVAFRHTLIALREVLAADYESLEAPMLTKTSDFLLSIVNEMKIENESENETATPPAR